MYARLLIMFKNVAVSNDNFQTEDQTSSLKQNQVAAAVREGPRKV